MKRSHLIKLIVIGALYAVGLAGTYIFHHPDNFAISKANDLLLEEIRGLTDRE